jgi:hypothetical protein
MGEVTLTMSVGEIAMRKQSDQRPGVGADIRTRH